MASYYDRVLEDFDTRESEGIFDEGIYDEGIYDEGIFDEGVYDEALLNRRRSGPRLRPSLRQPANFAKNVSGATKPGPAGNFVTKAELRNSLNSISTQVNELKKSSISIASTIKRIDDGYEKVVKSIARKDKAQDSVMSGSTMMSLLSTMVNKPTLNSNALRITDGDTANPKGKIEVVQGQDPIVVDLTKTLLFTMMPMMMNSGASGGDNNMMMMLLMVMLLGNKSTTGGTTGNDNTLMLMLPMMMMMKK